MGAWTLDGLSSDRRKAMEFLQSALPVSDLDCYPFDYFLACVDHALMARKFFPWCIELSEELFFHYVVCPRVNNEDLSEHRRLFFEQLRPRVEGLCVEEAVLEVNRWCHEWACYQSQDERTASPLTVFRCGSGRCGEESAFLVAALRSVGIAARQVYVPRWAHCDDNHAWVEALCNGVWRFLGACEPEPVLDRGWFNTAASRAMLVRSRLFGKGTSPLHGEAIGNENGVECYNQIARYAKTARYLLKATQNGRPVRGAFFKLQLLNEAAYHTIATLTADESGEAFITLGVGDIHIRCAFDGMDAEADCTGTEITLDLGAAPIQDDAWTKQNIIAPQSAPVRQNFLTQAQKSERAAVLFKGNGLRTSRVRTYYDADRAASLTGREDLLMEARGNFNEIFSFLSGGDAAGRERLARTLAAKDIRDTSCAILEEHLFNTPPLTDEVPEDIYRDYVVCPRVAFEKLGAWRKPLRAWLSDAEQARFRDDPRALWRFLTERIRLENGWVYKSLYWTPLEALDAGRCDEKSFRVLFVAQLRALGVPARLRPLDGAAEFWKDGAFHTVKDEAACTLCLKKCEGQNPLYGQNWSLSRKNADGWSLLTLFDGGWRGFEYAVSLLEGSYRLITAVRLPNGNQFAARRDFQLKAGERVTIPLNYRTFVLRDLLGSQELPPLPAATLAGTPVADAVRAGGRPALLFWMEEGSEPTEHVLNELAANRESLKALPIDVRFFLRAKESLSNATLAGVLRGWPEIQTLFDDWAFDQETVARCLGCDPERLPLAVACDAQGRAVYGAAGYQVGLVELMTRIAAHLCVEAGQ